MRLVLVIVGAFALAYLAVAHPVINEVLNNGPNEAVSDVGLPKEPQQLAASEEPAAATDAQLAPQSVRVKESQQAAISNVPEAQPASIPQLPLDTQQAAIEKLPLTEQPAGAKSPLPEQAAVAPLTLSQLTVASKLIEKAAAPQSPEASQPDYQAFQKKGKPGPPYHKATAVKSKQSAGKPSGLAVAKPKPDSSLGQASAPKSPSEQPKQPSPLPPQQQPSADQATPAKPAEQPSSSPPAKSQSADQAAPLQPQQQQQQQQSQLNSSPQALPAEQSLSLAPAKSQPVDQAAPIQPAEEPLSLAPAKSQPVDQAAPIQPAEEPLSLAPAKSQPVDQAAPIQPQQQQEPQLNSSPQALPAEQSLSSAPAKSQSVDQAAPLQPQQQQQQEPQLNSSPQALPAEQSLSSAPAELPQPLQASIPAQATAAEPSQIQQLVRPLDSQPLISMALEPQMQQQLESVMSQVLNQQQPKPDPSLTQIPVHVILEDGVEDTPAQQVVLEINPEGKPDLTSIVGQAAPALNDPPAETNAGSLVRESVDSSQSDDLTTNSQYYYNRPAVAFSDSEAAPSGATPKRDISWAFNNGLDGRPPGAQVYVGDVPNHHHHNPDGGIDYYYPDGHYHHVHPGGYYPNPGLQYPGYPGAYPGAYPQYPYYPRPGK